MSEIVDGIKETVKEYLELLDDNIPIANYHMGSVTGLSQEIYNNRKKLGLFTLDDIEIDETKLDLRWDILYDEDVDPVIKWWLNGKQIEVKCFKDLAKAIADNNPIKVKK